MRTPTVNMAEWRKYTAMQKVKTKSKKTGEESTVADEIIVQWVSAEVSGKQQKYTRIGAQEYVPFEHEEITLANIDGSCLKHLRPQGLVVQSPIKLILVTLSFNSYLFTAAGRFATKLWPNMVINDKFIFH